MAHPTLDALFDGHFTLIAGPCVAESTPLCLQIARHVQQLCRARDIGYVFKASFDKANRTSGHSFRGNGLQAGLESLQAVSQELGVATLTDVHLPAHVEAVAAVVDVLQIPAFLCRQSDLIAAAAQSGRATNVKKGQFLAPADMRHVADKYFSFGGQQLMVTERGTTFGYHDLVVDMRALITMREDARVKVVFDATHSVQSPGGNNGTSGGNRLLAPPLARAAAAVGIDALFCEVHPRPDEALSDGPNSLDFSLLERSLDDVLAVRKALRDTLTRP